MSQQPVSGQAGISQQSQMVSNQLGTLQQPVLVPGQAGTPQQPQQPQPVSPAEKDAKKKMIMKICCSIGGVIVGVLIVVAVMAIIGQGGKTVNCVMNTSDMGLTLKAETNVKVKDGEIPGGDMTVEVDLKGLDEDYKDYGKEMVDKMTEEYKEHCDEEHCVFNYNYNEGDKVVYTMQYDNEGVKEIVRSYGVEEMSAQEIADKVQDTLEDNPDTVCKQL